MTKNAQVMHLIDIKTTSIILQSILWLSQEHQRPFEKESKNHN